ncbi:MAG: tRNA pseudouridine(38-40) synthase TruA [Clostridiales bacterium]|nr:tRNA pseudouridine(38-40) synthase TruA [Clostridiales bacterium]
MKRILITIQYDGTNYSGWQKQKNEKTIQGEIENAIFLATGKNIEIFGSGRTDAGVHALHQTAHFDLDIPIPIEKLPQIINNRLPKDISILSAQEVDASFHARFDIKQKQYLYKIYQTKEKQPFIANYFAFVKEKIDIDKMRDCASLLIGEHSFKGFCSADTSATNFVRTIFDIDIQNVSENEIHIVVSGSGFLYNMVRILVGTMIDYSQDKLELNDVQQALTNGDREKAGQTMPPNGLYLYNTIY